MQVLFLLSLVYLATAASTPLNVEINVNPNQLHTQYFNSQQRYRRDASDIANEYLPPNAEKEIEHSQDTAVLDDQGYKYKTVRRLKLRQRRDVSEIANEYLPPGEGASTELKSEDEEPQESAILGDSGYEYKTVRRLKLRQRREVPDEYLPPNQKNSEVSVAELQSSDEDPQETAVLGNEGYKYKTIRRLKLRHRRDVSEINDEYLPPAEETSIDAVSNDEESQGSANLGDQGYEYKTVRRLKLRHRRDVSEISSDYLPPAEEASDENVAGPKSNDNESQDSALLGDQGYEYKTVRRLKLRQRRDVSEISDEYLPPVEETAQEAIADEEASQDSTALGDQGYEYKTVRRLKLRHRRDASEINVEYLPPIEETAQEAVSNEGEPQDSTVLGDQGYEYKTVRRLKLRQRRDLAEISDEYLPPAAEASNDEEPSQDSTVLGDQGYEYKTIRRLKLRQRRDASEINEEYLPPAEETANENVAEEEPSQDSTVLGDQGYEYKTIRRLKLRQRRDASEINEEYLPPAEETANENVAEEEASQDSTVLGEQGYEYKTIRRLKLRQRRDASEINEEYLPPAEEAANENVAEEEASQDSTVLGDQGYEYKTVRRLKLRQRRDASEINEEYLPPAEEAANENVANEETSQDSTALGDQGYEYKTVRRLKLRQRRDASEINEEYLPPTEETNMESVADIKSEGGQPLKSSVLGEQGYEYKTIRRLKYRQRRDIA